MQLVTCIDRLDLLLNTDSIAGFFDMLAIAFSAAYSPGPFFNYKYFDHILLYFINILYQVAVKTWAPVANH